MAPCVSSSSRTVSTQIPDAAHSKPTRALSETAPAGRRAASRAVWGAPCREMGAQRPSLGPGSDTNRAGGLRETRQ